MEVFLLPIQTKSRLHSFVSLTIRLEYENNPSLAIVAMAACPTSLQTSQLQQRCPPTLVQQECHFTGLARWKSQR